MRIIGNFTFSQHGRCHVAVHKVSKVWHRQSEDGWIPLSAADLLEVQSESRRGLPMWVIYNSPADFSGRYVVRRWVSVCGDWCGTLASPTPLAVVGSLEAAREAVPLGAVNIGREGPDDPTIVECWI